MLPCPSACTVLAAVWLRSGAKRCAWACFESPESLRPAPEEAREGKKRKKRRMDEVRWRSFRVCIRAHLLDPCIALGQRNRHLHKRVAAARSPHLQHQRSSQHERRSDSRRGQGLGTRLGRQPRRAKRAASAFRHQDSVKDQQQKPENLCEVARFPGCLISQSSPMILLLALCALLSGAHAYQWRATGSVETKHPSFVSVQVAQKKK